MMEVVTVGLVDKPEKGKMSVDTTSFYTWKYPLWMFFFKFTGDHVSHFNLGPYCSVLDNHLMWILIIMERFWNSKPYLNTKF
jgi:hypothetical protein